MRKRHTEEQIIRILKEAEESPVEKVPRKHNVSSSAFYRWKSNFGGMDVSKARRLRLLEDENNRLKKLVAEQALDIQMLKDVNSKKWQSLTIAARSSHMFEAVMR